MKLVAMLLAILPTFAQAKALHCDNGTIGEDSYVQVSVSEAAVEFNMHETHVAALAADFVKSKDGKSMAVLGKTYKGSAEGDEFSTKVDALLVIDAAKKTMNVTLIMDGNPSISAEELKCK